MSAVDIIEAVIETASQTLWRDFFDFVVACFLVAEERSLRVLARPSSMQALSQLHPVLFITAYNGNITGAYPTILFQVFALHINKYCNPVHIRINSYPTEYGCTKKNNNNDELTKKTGEPNSNTKLRNDTEVQL